MYQAATRTWLGKVSTSPNMGKRVPPHCFLCRHIQFQGTQTALSTRFLRSAAQPLSRPCQAYNGHADSQLILATLQNSIVERMAKHPLAWYSNFSRPYLFPDDEYEADNRRLYVHNRLVTEAFDGKLLLCPLDLSQPSLRILDVATGNGEFLRLLYEELGSPENVELIGTDINPDYDNYLPPTAMLEPHDFFDEWPRRFGKFDLVHMSTALAYMKDRETAVSTVRRMIQVLNPGRYIQLLDGALQDDVFQKIQSGDRPSVKVLKILLLGVKGQDNDPSLGKETHKILTEAGHGLVRNVNSIKAAVICGKGAATKELEDMGIEYVRGQYQTARGILSSIPPEKRPMTDEDFENLLPDLMREASEEGIKFHYIAAWAQKI